MDGFLWNGPPEAHCSGKCRPVGLRVGFLNCFFSLLFCPFSHMGTGTDLKLLIQLDGP